MGQSAGLCLGPRRTGIGKHVPALGESLLHPCSSLFHPWGSMFLAAQGRLGLTNLINGCQVLRAAQTDSSHKVQSDICAEKKLFGPETLMDIKMPSRAGCGDSWVLPHLACGHGCI